MNLAHSALRRPFTVLVAAIAALLVSIVAWRQMPRDIFPSLNLPTIYVAQSYGGMDPAQMEGYLTYYFEYHFLYLTGIEHVESKSIQGAALIKLQFHPGTDMAQAMAETVAYVNRARAFMPPGTVPPFIMRFDAGSVPVGNLVFSSETHSIVELQDAALNRIRPLFATLPGVSAPPPFGGNARTIVINLKPDRLQSYHMSPDEVVSAIAAANLISASGNINMAGKYPMVPLNSVPKNVKDLGAVPVRSGTFPPVFVRDVGNVVDGSDIVTSYALMNGKRVVYIPVTKRADASTLSVVNRVKKSIPNFQAALPVGMTVTYEMDQSPCVKQALASLPLEAALGSALTGLMILAFLRDARSALIVVLNIPLSLMAAMAALWITGQTLNIMTLGGLALAVGVLVDEATVCLENIQVHRVRGEGIAEAVLAAATETAGPRLLAMLCIVAMFIPVLFMVGIARAMFLPLALAVAFAMVASYLLSSTLVPILSVWLMQGKHALPPPTRFVQLQKIYGRTLQAIRPMHRWLMLGYFGFTISIIALISPRLGTAIFPQGDTAQLQIRLRAPAGTDIDQTELIALKTLEIIKQTAGPRNVQSSLSLLGLHGAAYPINFLYVWNGGTEEGVIQIQLTPQPASQTEVLKEHLRREFSVQLPTVDFSFEPADIVSRVMSLNVAMPIEVAVSGPNLAANRLFAEKVKATLEKLNTLRDVQFGQSLDYPTVNVVVDRERAGILGTDMAQISRALVPATWSSRFAFPNYWSDPNSGVAYQMQVQIPQRLMNSPEDLGNIAVDRFKDKSILLRNVAQITVGTTLSQHDRYNMQRLIAVRANIAGSDLGKAARQVRNGIAELGNPPAGVNISLRGQAAPMQEMLNGLGQGLVVAIAAIFLLLTAYFQSIKLAFIVMSSLPAVLTGVELALWLTGTSVNLQSFMGAIMAVGVSMANAILLVISAERIRLGGGSAGAAAAYGAQNRLRPILMTSGAMLAGMSPMAFGLKQGSAQTAPLGLAVIGGLLAATIATLLVVPGIFAVVQSQSHRRSASFTLDGEIK
ncbi:MAG: swrC [Verrucomicrobiales bacterium]|nr:swrC [Verrucomicrobiales bacterium]